MPVIRNVRISTEHEVTLKNSLSFLLSTSDFEVILRRTWSLSHRVEYRKLGAGIPFSATPNALQNNFAIVLLTSSTEQHSNLY
jgi:hypothetical protein